MENDHLVSCLRDPVDGGVSEVGQPEEKQDLGNQCWSVLGMLNLKD